MIFKSPLYDLQSEFYRLLSDPDDGVQFPVFDGSVALDEILEPMQNMDDVKFGIIAEVNATPSSAKVDTIRWRCSIRVEHFSSYTGRKVVTDMIDKLGNVITSLSEPFRINMINRGYDVIDQRIGDITIGPAMANGSITWQNGYVELIYNLSQIE